MSETTRTQVLIIGAGPAGLMISQMLHNRGVESVAIDIRTREEIENTHRAGILEAKAVRMLEDENVSQRFRTDGYEHDGTDIRVRGISNRISFKDLVGASVWLYPQTDVFIDLANARERDGGDVRFGVSDVELLDGDSDNPGVRFTDAAGTTQEVRADFVVGSDGSRSICRALIPGATQYFREYPFAWFGIMAEAPMSYDELIYASSDRGFALISQRTPTVQRMYLQCNPSDDMHNWSEDQLWDEFQARVAGPDGFELKTGPIFERTLLPFRSFVQQPMQHGRVSLAGDAAHTVPPTGARGLNLALSDARVLAPPRLAEAAKANDPPAKLADYEEIAVKRVWRAQNFSYWMTTMLHSLPDENPFDRMRRLGGELEMVLGHESGRRHLAEAYAGWPNEVDGL